MVDFSLAPRESSEDLLARLTEAAYRAVLEAPPGGRAAPSRVNFLEVQLGIWHSLRSELDHWSATTARPATPAPPVRPSRVEVVSWRT